MSGITDLTGQKFGRLTVLRTFKGDGGHTWSECVCDCNGINTKLVKNKNLKGGHTNSCGCLSKEQLQRIHGEGKSTNHYFGKYSKHPNNKKLRSVWRVMKHRCYNENYKGYEFYGAKGTKICKEWIDNYDLFFEWSIENGYFEGLSIDRIDFEKEYSPENCRWATIEIQSNNTSQNVWAEYNGEKYTVAQLSKMFDYSARAIENRIENGIYIHREIERIPYYEVMETIGDETMSIYDFADKYNIGHVAIKNRYMRGNRGFDLIRPVEESKLRTDKNPEFGGFKRGDIVKYNKGNKSFVGRIYSFSKNQKEIGIIDEDKNTKKVNIKFLTLIERPSEIK